MATLNQIIYNISNLKAKGNISDDSSISPRQWAFIIAYYRNVLIRQSLQKGYKISDNILQDLGKVKVKKVTGEECCDIKGCHIYKVESPLPKAIDLNGVQQITYLGTEKGRAFQKTTYSAVKYDSVAKYTGKMDKWFQIGEDTYISSPSATLGKYVNVKGVFEDPKIANEYKTCDCDNDLECHKGYDFEYPMSTHLIDAMNKLIMDAELRLFMTQQADKTNNSTDDN